MQAAGRAFHSWGRKVWWSTVHPFCHHLCPGLVVEAAVQYYTRSTSSSQILTPHLALSRVSSQCLFLSFRLDGSCWLTDKGYLSDRYRMDHFSPRPNSHCAAVPHLTPNLMGHSLPAWDGSPLIACLWSAMAPMGVRNNDECAHCVPCSVKRPEQVRVSE